MMAGPRTLLFTISAPASMTTRPSMADPASTDPSTRGSSDSSTNRLHWSSGSFLPVSIHQPSRTSWLTRWPWSISHWMASVISSSPRHDGGDGVVHAAVEQVDTHQRQVGRRVDRLLDQPHDLAPVRQLGHAELAGVVHPGPQDLRRPRPSVARRPQAGGEAGPT